MHRLPTLGERHEVFPHRRFHYVSCKFSLRIFVSCMVKSHFFWCSSKLYPQDVISCGFVLFPIVAVALLVPRARYGNVMLQTDFAAISRARRTAFGFYQFCVALKTLSSSQEGMTAYGCAN